MLKALGMLNLALAFCMTPTLLVWALSRSRYGLFLPVGLFFAWSGVRMLQGRRRGLAGSIAALLVIALFYCLPWAAKIPATDFLFWSPFIPYLGGPGPGLPLIYLAVQIACAVRELRGARRPG